MRIVSGQWGGRRLEVPRGSATRPTSEKVRAAVANALEAAGALDGARVLDLYAGTGAFALELLSRGAHSATLVEHGRDALAAARKNIAALAAAQATLVAADVTAFVRSPGGCFDIIVADPPYSVDGTALAAVLRTLWDANGVDADCHLVVEVAARSGEIPWPAPLRADRAKRYGDTLICYGRVS